MPLALLLTTSCATTELWSGNSKDEYIKLLPKEESEDVELALKGSGKEYYCKDLYYSTHKNNKICYMKISEAKKSKDLKVKFLKTPEAVVTDVGNTIFFVGYAIVYTAFNSGYTNEHGFKMLPSRE